MYNNIKFNNMITVLKFYAVWCAPCKILSKILGDRPEIKEVNIEDDTEELRSKYRVRNVPTLIFLKDEEEVNRIVCIIRLEDYEEIINNLNK